MPYHHDYIMNLLLGQTQWTSLMLHDPFHFLNNSIGKVMGCSQTREREKEWQNRGCWQKQKE